MRKLSMEELGRSGLEEYKNKRKKKLIIILDDIRSQQNTGAIFRTSDAYLVEKIILCGITATPPHREIQRSALGATESVVWEYSESAESAAKHLKNQGFTLLGIEQTDRSVMLNDYIPKSDEKLAVVFGNEVNGINEKLLPFLDQCIELPQFGTKHSLNVSVCAGIVIWDLFHKLS